MLAAFLAMVVALIRLWRASSDLLHQPMGNFAHYRRVKYRQKTMPLLLLLFVCFMVAEYEKSPYGGLLMLAFGFTIVWNVLSLSGSPKICPECGGATEAFYDTPDSGAYKQYYYVCPHCRLYFEGTALGKGGE